MKKISVILMLFLLAGCFGKYSMLKSQINRAITPKEIIGVAVDIQLSDLSKEEKSALTLDLAKRSIKILSYFAKDISLGNMDVSRSDIKDILNFIADNINVFRSISPEDTEELIKSFTQIMIRGMKLGR